MVKFDLFLKLLLRKKVSFNKIDFKLSSRLKDLLKEFKAFYHLKAPNRSIITVNIQSFYCFLLRSLILKVTWFNVSWSSMNCSSDRRVRPKIWVPNSYLLYTGQSGSVLEKDPSRLQDEKHIFCYNSVGFSYILQAALNRDGCPSNSPNIKTPLVVSFELGVITYKSF